MYLPIYKYIVKRTRVHVPRVVSTPIFMFQMVYLKSAWGTGIYVNDFLFLIGRKNIRP